MFANRKLVLIT